MKYLLLAVLVSSAAHAQAFIPEGEGGPPVEIPDPSATDHINQDISVQSVTSTASAGTAGLTVPTGAYVCLNDLCTTKLYYTGLAIKMAGDLEVDSLTTGGINAREFITNAQEGEPLQFVDSEGYNFTCQNELLSCGDYVPFGTVQILCTDYSVHVCTNYGWASMASSLNSQPVHGGTDIAPYRVIIQAQDNEVGFQNLHNSRVDFGDGTNDYVRSDGTIIHASIWYFGQVGANQINPSNGDRTTFIGSEGLRLYPLGAGATCDGAEDTGTLSTESTGGRFLYCNGATKETVAFTNGPWTGAVDFADFPATGCQTASFLASGLSVDDTVVSTGCRTLEDSDDDLQCTVTHSDDEVFVRACCYNDSVGCGDPGSVNFSVKTLR